MGEAGPAADLDRVLTARLTVRTSVLYRQGRYALSTPWGAADTSVMELTERERRIIAEMEHQFPTGTPGTTDHPGGAAPKRRSLRPKWMVTAAAVLGIVLVVTGVGLGVGSSVLLGTFFVVWWLSPVLWSLLRRIGSRIRESFEDAPPGATQ